LNIVLLGAIETQTRNNLYLFIFIFKFYYSYKHNPYPCLFILQWGMFCFSERMKLHFL
jgi:hypothetical protein